MEVRRSGLWAPDEKQKAKEAKKLHTSIRRAKVCLYHYWVSCAINRGGFLEIAFVVVVVVDTHLPRFEALAYVLPHFDALTHLVIRVSSAFIFQMFAEVCYSVFVNRSS